MSVSRSLVLAMSGALLSVGALAGCAHRPEAASEPARDALEAAAPSASGASPEIVTLRFDWPIGLRTVIEGRNERLQDGRSRLPFSAVSFEEAQVVDDPRGLRVEIVDSRVEGLPETARDVQSKILLAAIRAAAEIEAETIISREGELLDVEGIEQVSVLIRDVFDEFLTEEMANPNVRAAIEPMIAQLSSREFLLARISEPWNASVAFWVGGELELGERYVLDFVQPMPLLGNVELDMQTEFSAIKRVPCHSGDRDTRCVRLETLTTPNAEAMAAALDAWARGLAVRMGRNEVPPGPLYDSLDIMTRTVVITEPETLIPHALEMTKEIRFTSRDDLGRTQEDERVDRQTYVYTYPDRD